MRQSDSASLLISNIDMVGYGISQLIGSVVAAVTLFGIAVAALVISPTITLLAIAGGGLVVLAHRGLRRRSREIGEKHNQAYALIHAEVGEGLAAIRIIKTFGAEKKYSERLQRHFAALREAQHAFIRDVGIGQLMLQGGGASLLAVVVWFAVSVWDAGISAVLPMVALFVRAMPLLDALQQASQNAAHAWPALGRAMALLARAESGRELDPTSGAHAPRALRSIRLVGVGVDFAGRSTPALDEVSFELRPGTITALIGPSGAGKSTVADVLGGLIAPDRGQLVIDNVPLDDSMRRCWRQQVAYVQQEPILFTGTIRENLLLSRPTASSAEMSAALKRASASFIEQMPAGLDTPLAERGAHLSGGERQRIALARALLRDPRLLILDEATSALDRDNEAQIAAAVGAMRGDMAILVIGHRGSLADIADCIMRVENGRVL
jgi:ATP-binding cassette subfamily C protein